MIRQQSDGHVYLALALAVLAAILSVAPPVPPRASARFLLLTSAAEAAMAAGAIGEDPAIVAPPWFVSN
jgi:hypothetical protein